MAKRRRTQLLGPLKSARGPIDTLADSTVRAARLLKEARAVAAQLRGRAKLSPLPTADEIVPDDAYSRAFGYDRARQLLDPELEPRRFQAAQRRLKVLEMSLAGRRVSDIAAAVGLHAAYVVKVRARLRDEGKLPPL